MPFCGHFHTSASTNETQSILSVCEVKRQRVVHDLMAQKIILQYNNNSYSGALHILLSQTLFIYLVFSTVRIRSPPRHAGKINFLVKIPRFGTTLLVTLMDRNTVRALGKHKKKKKKHAVLSQAQNRNRLYEARFYETLIWDKLDFLEARVCRVSREPWAQNAPPVGPVVNCSLVIRSHRLPGFGSSCF